jgi:hypothetical protein
MKMKATSFSLHPDNIAYIDDQWKVKGKRNKSHWLDDLITHLREKSEAAKPKVKAKQFKAPVKEEVHAYMKERGLESGLSLIESEKFCDFYEMKGWMVGKNKMKDWKAAVRNWLKGQSTEVKKDDRNGFTALTERANSGELYETTQDFFLAPNGKKYSCMADYYAGKESIE